MTQVVWKEISPQKKPFNIETKADMKGQYLSDKIIYYNRS